MLPVWFQSHMQEIFSTFWDYAWLNDYIFCLMNGVLGVVLACMGALLSEKGVFLSFYENTTLEFSWTIFPLLVLLFIGGPSLSVLYHHSVDFSSEVSVKVIGHQWYWSYEYAGFPNVMFDSFMVPTDQLKFGEFRLLEVSERMVVPGFQFIRVVVTSSDVLHSWALPSMGVKVDACPGRLNFIFFKPVYYGVFFGQCSEICGSNHSFMPIAMEVSSVSLFSRWLDSF